MHADQVGAQMYVYSAQTPKGYKLHRQLYAESSALCLQLVVAENTFGQLGRWLRL
jgi:hypothetical protein